ncbi:MAG: DMT family transporter [Gammaproteobacteria bacterium]|nr:DMT family transporter [Gammaproteobacteria bacterium]
MKESNWKIGLPLALVTAFMWGLLPIAMKGLLNDISATTVTWFRFTGAALIATIFYSWNRQLQLRTLFHRRLRIYTLIAIAGLLGNYIAYSSGLRYIPAESVQLILQLAPILLVIASVIWLGENFTLRQWVGVAMVVLGLLLFFNQRLHTLINGTDKQYLIGIGLALVAAVAWSLYGVMQKKISASVRPHNLLVLIYLAGFLCFLPISSPGSVARLDGLEWMLLLFLPANTLISYGAFGKAMMHWEASRVSATLALAPLMTLLFSAIINVFWPTYIEAETLNWVSWLGALCVVCGSLSAAISRRAKSVSH